jgi:hypothetical protein
LVCPCRGDNGIGSAAGLAASDDPTRFIPRILVSSTIPANGDLNPYGVAFVPPGFPAGGPLKPGDLLVSNFNNSNNLQGTGTTIINLRPSSGAAADGTASVFFQGTPPLGFTLALGVLQRGFVIVGNVTTTDGKSDTVAAGPLLFIDRNGKLVKSFTTSLDGPWGLALVDGFDHAKVFISNVLNGTVTRIALSLPDSETVNVTGTTQKFTKTGHFIGEYNIHQNQTSTSGEGQGHPDNDIARLAVVNDNANNVAVTAFVLP